MCSIVIPTNKGPKLFQDTDIIRIEASSNYSKIFFTRFHPLTIAKGLQWFEKVLPTCFRRIHKTHLVNQQHVAALSGDGCSVVLSTGERLVISRRKRTVMRRQLQYC